MCGSCSFDDSTFGDADCGYEDASTGEYHWINYKANSSSSSHTKPPPVDHSQGTEEGHYMFVDHSNNIWGNKSVLNSPLLGDLSQLCSLQFWYHMAGESEMNLIVNLLVGSSRFL